MRMFLTDIFLYMWVMSYMATIAASITCIATIIFSRMKVPAYITLFMWVAVLIRMVSPFSFSLEVSPYRLPYVGDKLESMGQLGDRYFDTKELKVFVEGMPEYDRAVQAGAAPKTTPVGNAVYMEKDGITPAKTVGEAGLPLVVIVIWMGGILAIWLYAAISYFVFKKKVKTAVLFKENIYMSENIKSPFVLGFFAPKIYLPYGLEEEQREYIILHEQIHIARRDYLIKPLAFLVCSLYWYNWYLWGAMRAFIEQMEISCDELVIKKLGTHVKSNYCQALLDYAIRFFGVSPIAFGEVGTKIRIKSIMKYKNPNKAKIAISVVICVVVCVFCLANPIS